MTYYKIVVDCEIVAVCTDYDFCRYQAKHNVIVATGPDSVEAVQAGGVFYHDTWMSDASSIPHTAAAVTEITADEYTVLEAQLDSGTIPDDGSLEEIVEDPSTPVQPEEPETVKRTTAQILEEQIRLAARYAEV